MAPFLDGRTVITPQHVLHTCCDICEKSCKCQACVAIPCAKEPQLPLYNNQFAIMQSSSYQSHLAADMLQKLHHKILLYRVTKIGGSGQSCLKTASLSLSTIELLTGLTDKMEKQSSKTTTLFTLLLTSNICVQFLIVTQLLSLI